MKTDKPNESEIIIDVPVALGMMASGFLWPLSAWNELVTGELLVAGDEVNITSLVTFLFYSLNL